MNKTGIIIGAVIIIAFIGGIYALVHQSGSIDENSSIESEQAAGDTRKFSYGKDGPITAYNPNETALFEVLVVLRDQGGDSASGVLRRGDVIAVRKSPHEWSKTEYASYLIVPIRMKGSDADTLLVPKKDSDRVVASREKGINLEKVGFSEAYLSGEQPFLGKEFDTSIIENR